jgi:hypothetical protein
MTPIANHSSTGFLCRGCRSETVATEGTHCPMCSAIHVNRELTRSHASLGPALIGIAIIAIFAVVNFVRKNFGQAL